jgi:glutamate--cysteine ligase
VKHFTENQSQLLLAPFENRHGSNDSVGVEIEMGLVDPLTGTSRPYHGERGVKQFLHAVREAWDGTAYYDGEDIIGIRRADGTDIGIESGCAIEYGSTPERSLATLVQKSNRDLRDLANLAGRLNLCLLSGSMLPFDGPQQVNWAPKSRIPFMLQHFEREVGCTSQGWAAMTQIITVQTTLDFADPADLCRKHRMANVVSPMVAALFVNSPIQNGVLTGADSRRMQVWAGVDPKRVGMFRHSIKSEFSIGDVIDWAVELPMIYRVVGGKISAAPERLPFRDLLREGFGDGTFPALEDWTAMLNTTWPYVRVRDTLELRIADGLSYKHWAAGPALWLGLSYDHQACEDAWNLASGYPLTAYLNAVDDVAMHGLDASIDGRPIRAISRELLSIAYDGLSRRVKDRRDSDIILTYLDPLFETIESGQSFSRILASRWANEWAQDPARYVENHYFR